MQRDAWRGTEEPAVSLKLFNLTLGSKSSPINVSPLRIVSSHHYGHHRDPSASAGATGAFQPAANCCCFLTASAGKAQTSQCGSLSSGSWSQEGLRLTAASSAASRRVCDLPRTQQVSGKTDHAIFQGYVAVQRYLAPQEDTDSKANIFIPADQIYFGHTIYICISKYTHY